MARTAQALGSFGDLQTIGSKIFFFRVFMFLYWRAARIKNPDNHLADDLNSHGPKKTRKLTETR
jgi:hypothetical protein